MEPPPKRAKGQEAAKQPISKAELRQKVKEEKAKAAALAQEAAKQEKAALRLQTLEAKRLKKEADSLCSACISKVSPVLTKLDKAFENDLASSLPKPIWGDAKQSQSLLEKLVKVAKENVSAERLSDRDREALRGVDAAVSQAKRHCSAVQDFLKTLVKHS